MGKSLCLGVFMMCRNFCNNGIGCNEIGLLLSIIVPLMSLGAPGCAKGKGRGLATSSYLIKCKSKRRRNTQDLTLITLQQDQLLQFKEVQTGAGGKWNKLLKISLGLAPSDLIRFQCGCSSSSYVQIRHPPQNALTERAARAPGGCQLFPCCSDPNFPGTTSGDARMKC